MVQLLSVAESFEQALVVLVHMTQYSLIRELFICQRLYFSKKRELFVIQNDYEKGSF